MTDENSDVPGVAEMAGYEGQCRFGNTLERRLALPLSAAILRGCQVTYGSCPRASARLRTLLFRWNVPFCVQRGPAPVYHVGNS